MLAEKHRHRIITRSADLEELLTGADSLLGRRGTFSAFLAILERGGASSGTAYDPYCDAQLRAVPRLQRAMKRWQGLERAQQAILVAFYCASHFDPSAANYTVERSRDAVPLRVPYWVTQRFGELGGVVVLLWCQAAEKRRAKKRAVQARSSQAELQGMRAVLAPIEARLKAAQAAAREGFRQVFPPTVPPTRVAPLAAFRAMAAAHYLERAGRPLRSARDAALSRDAAVVATSIDDVTRDVEELARVCELGEPALLREKATRAVRTAHGVWDSTRNRDAAEFAAWAGGVD